MKKMLNISNHTMSLEQLKEIQERGYDLIELPENLKNAWGQLEPSNYPIICNQIIEYAEENKIDAFHLAGFAPAVNLICMDMNTEFPIYYAYSKRESVEIEIEGQIVKKSIFKHIGFFRYVTCKEHLQNWKELN